MAIQTYEQALADYEASRRELYAPVWPGALERGEGFASTAAPERVDDLVDSSQRLRDVLSEAVETGDRDLRDLASLKLLAAAAADLAIANDLIEAGEEPTGLASLEPERGASSIFADPIIRSVLDAPLLGTEMRKGQIERGALPADAKEARSALQEEVNAALNGIVNAAADLSVSCMTGAVNFGLGPAQMLASGAVSELLKHVPDAVSFGLRAAARLVIEAIRKLWATFGKDVQDTIQGEAEGWFKKIWNDGALVTGFLKQLYKLDGLTDELKFAIGNASDQSDFNSANKECAELEARYAKIKSILDWVLRGLGWLKGPLMAALPWGPVAGYAIFAGIMGYAVYSGGDYVDS